MLSTDATVPDYSRKSTPSGGGGMKLLLALVIALAFIFAGLWVFALTRNAPLEKRAIKAERIADERAAEITEMAHKCGLAARVSLEKLSKSEEPETVDDKAEEDELHDIDAGIDGSSKYTAKW